MKAICILLLLFLFTGCKSKQTKITPGDDVYYTCSMHPQVMQHTPGKCPICGMKLIAMKSNKAPDKDEIQLTEQQIRLANISVDTIHSGMMGNKLILNATLNFDQEKITAISSRVMGRVEKLYFKNPGDYVKKGDKLYDLYSEDLNNAKKEYILAIEKRSALGNSIIDFEQIVRSAKNKLLLWGLTESEIQHLADSKEAGLTTSMYSNASGYINSLDIKEGDYVMEGGMIAHIAGLSTLWAEAQVYNSELSIIEKDAVAEVQAGQKTFNGKIDFINSEVNSDSRISLLRVSIPNNDNQLKPGMPAYVTIKNQQHKMLSLPIDAVLRDANGATVWLMTRNCTFKNAMVETGMEVGDRIEITSGLSDGDVVVITGAYLLNSEYIFRNGANPMAGMKM
jgi:Cu(I)/Ag(I) efflux system membrane fusion protein